MMSSSVAAGFGKAYHAKAVAVCFATLLLSETAFSASPSLTRLYDFEEGSAAATAPTAIDTIGDPPHLQTAFGAFFAFDSQIAGSNDSVPNGEPLQTWITNNVDITPSLTEPFVGTAATFVDVTAGGSLSSPSPAPGSTLGLEFDGLQALQAPGFKDSFVTIDAFNADAPAANGDNVLSTFFNFSEAWVYPRSSGDGTEQTVWAVGRENGGVQITSDGFWNLTAVGGATPGAATVPVAFDEWTHVAVARGGGSATLYVNGSIAATGSGFFGVFGDFVTLGADETLASTFIGVVDNFGVGGNLDGGFSVIEDISFFADLGLPAPTGVAGDVDQDGDADQTDYDIWSQNVGFNNGFGVGDVTTLLLGDLDNNGRVDFFDFNEIAAAVRSAGGSLVLASIPEPTAVAGAVLACLATLAGDRRRGRC